MTYHIGVSSDEYITGKYLDLVDGSVSSYLTGFMLGDINIFLFSTSRLLVTPTWTIRRLRIFEEDAHILFLKHGNRSPFYFYNVCLIGYANESKDFGSYMTTVNEQPEKAVYNLSKILMFPT